MDPSVEDDSLDRLWEQDFGNGEDDVDEDEHAEFFGDDEALALEEETHHCDVDGLLRLNGTINVEKERIYMNCRRLVGEGLFNLSAPLHFSDHLDLEGNLTVVAVKAGFGCITVRGHLRVSGNITVRGCQSKTDGGAIWSTNFTMESGDLNVQHCSAMNGGAIFANHLHMQGGNMEITDCQALFNGGAIYARKLLMLGGRLCVDGCSADFGGALHSHNIRQTGGELTVQSCVAHYNGGAINAEFEYSLSTGEFVARNCSAGEEGGGLRSTNMTQTGGSFVVENCQAKRSGGGVHIMKELRQLRSQLTFENCSAADGGGLAVGHEFKYEGTFVQFPSGSATFRNCRAVRSGGCLYSKGKLQISGSLDFETATSEYGGGMCVEGIVDASKSKMSFSNCHTTASGASLWVTGTTRLGRVSVEKCSPGMLSAVLVARKDLIAKQVMISGDTKSSIELSAVAGVYAEVESMVCKDTDHCELRADQGETRLGDLRCPLGSGRVHSLTGAGCRRCPASMMSLLDTINASCQGCPDGAEICLPDRLKMPAGMTVDPLNYSIALRCANPSACPGGELAKLHLPENVTGSQIRLEDQVSRAMCRDGYAGKTCEQCMRTHGMADSSPLQCTPCPKNSFFALTPSIAFYVTKEPGCTLVPISHLLRIDCWTAEETECRFDQSADGLCNSFQHCGGWSHAK